MARKQRTTKKTCLGVDVREHDLVDYRHPFSLSFISFDSFLHVVCSLSFFSISQLEFVKSWFHQVLGWSSCLALSNQQACVRPCCFTGRPRPLGTGFFNGSMVLSFDLLLPPLRFLTCGFLATTSPQLTASLSSLLPAKLSVSYPFFPILALHQFWPHRLLPPGVGIILLICLLAIFGLNDLRCSVVLQFSYVQFRIEKKDWKRPERQNDRQDQERGGWGKRRGAGGTDDGEERGRGPWSLKMEGSCIYILRGWEVEWKVRVATGRDNLGGNLGEGRRVLEWIRDDRWDVPSIPSMSVG